MDLGFQSQAMRSSRYMNLEQGGLYRAMAAPIISSANCWRRYRSFRGWPPLDIPAIALLDFRLDPITLLFSLRQAIDFRPSQTGHLTPIIYQCLVRDISPPCGTRLLAGTRCEFRRHGKDATRRGGQSGVRSSLVPLRQRGRALLQESSGEAVHIIGMVADAKYFSLTENQRAAAYFPISQKVTTHTSFVVRMQPGSPDVATNEMDRPSARSSASLTLLFRYVNPVPGRASSVLSLSHPRWPIGRLGTLRRVWIAALRHRYLRARLLHCKQAAARVEHPGCPGSTGAAGPLGCTWPDADSSGHRIRGRHSAWGRRPAVCFQQSSTRLRHRTRWC